MQTQRPTYTKGRRYKDTEGEDDHVTGLMNLQGKECQVLLVITKSQRSQGEILSQRLRRERALLTPRFWTSSFQKCKRINFCCFKPHCFLVLWYQPQENNMTLQAFCIFFLTEPCHHKYRQMHILNNFFISFLSSASFSSWMLFISQLWKCACFHRVRFLPMQQEIVGGGGLWQSPVVGELSGQEHGEVLFGNLRHSFAICALKQCFPNSTVYKNHLRILLKCQFSLRVQIKTSTILISSLIVSMPLF